MNWPLRRRCVKLTASEVRSLLELSYPEVREDPFEHVRHMAEGAGVDVTIHAPTGPTCSECGGSIDMCSPRIDRHNATCKGVARFDAVSKIIAEALKRKR